MGGLRWAAFFWLAIDAHLGNDLFHLHAAGAFDQDVITGTEVLSEHFHDLPVGCAFDDAVLGHSKRPSFIGGVSHAAPDDDH